ncbi:beta-ketoacyl-[acyl-carrier-protein] synthase family protein [Oxalobacteraceae bacterium CAVE-383]|nr:beta-ketoacyl-[acyl-carrier-protein] synthase family protein [Oxalobacteraceae bacterium CAVE-383]
MIYLNRLGMLCALGDSLPAIAGAMYAGRSGLRTDTRYLPELALPIGAVDVPDAALPPVDHLPLRDRSRNNRLALAALAQIRPAVDAAIARYGPDRVGVVVGTSTSGIAEGEAALRQYDRDGTLPAQFNYSQQELGSPAAALAQTLGVGGPAYTHSSACASSAKAMASAARLINMGLCDAVISGGIDTLCAFTLAGFGALESISGSRCRPFSANRDGINIGEAAALFLMSRDEAAVALLGWGEASDAHHISAPDPGGRGAGLAIRQALRRAGLRADDIDYINLHGTATPQNDAMESLVVAALFGERVAASSTKPLTGHALGAASAVEAGLCWLAMQDDNPQGRLPPHLWDGVPDPALPKLQLAADRQSLGRPLRRVLSNSFAFGGVNAALIFGRQ